MKKLLLSLLLSIPMSAFATTWNSDGSPSSIQTIHGQAVDGDTITLPAGTFTWTSGVSITKGITLQGQTTVNATNGTANDQTIIKDNLPRPPSQPIIRLTTTSGKTYRVTGITLDNGTVTATNSNGAVIVNGNSSSVRIDHNHWRQMPHQNVYLEIAGQINGVADHNFLESVTSTESFLFNTATNSDQYGDLAWGSVTGFGTSNFFFVEDNYVKNVSSPFNQLAGNTDDTRGGRWVFRHNHCYDIELQTHGTESGRYRGGRARESYSNDFHYAQSHPYAGIRSGVTISHDNTFDGVLPTTGVVVQEYRAFQPNDNANFGSGTGNNPWDVNDPHGLYASGTAAAGSNGTTLIDSGSPGWNPNQWAGFTAKRVSDGNLSWISSNTSNTLTVYFTPSGCCGGSAVWAAGDQYQIYKALILLDQPGRGQGDLLTGNTPPTNICTPTPGPCWPHEALEPTYEWNDVYTPTSTTLTVSTGTGNQYIELLNRDYYNSAMPSYTPYIYPHPLQGGPTPTATPTATFTPTPTATPSSTSTFTPTPTPTASPTATATSTPTATATATPTPASTPHAPTNVHVVSPTTLVWDANPMPDSVTAYKTYRIRSSNSTLVATVTPPTTSLSVSTSIQGSRSQFDVTAVNANGEGLPSSRVTVQKH